MAKRKLQLLVVEDDDLWRTSLAAVFNQIFRGRPNQITSVGSGPEALALLKANTFDLISVDIELSKKHARREDGRINLAVTGADGRAILRTAAELNSARAAVVVSGIASSDTLQVVIPNDEERFEARVELGAYVNRLFAGKGLYFQKACEGTHEERIQNTTKTILKNSDLILSVCGLEHRLTRNGRIWVVEFRGEKKSLKDSVGLRYLAYLIEHQTAIPAIELVSIFNPPDPTTDFPSCETDNAKDDDESALDALDNFERPNLGEETRPAHTATITRVVSVCEADVGPDTEDKAIMLQVLRNLKKRLDGAIKDGDSLLEVKYAKDLQAATKWYNSQVGISGRNRPVGSQREKARQSVSKALNRLKEEIKTSFPEFHRHLQSPDVLTIGYDCEYKDNSENWEVNF